MNIIFRTIRESCYHFCNGVYLLPEKAKAFFVPDDVEKLFPQGWNVLKDSRSVLSFLDRKHGCFIKIYRKNGFWRTLKRFLTLCPRSCRCLAGALLLQHLGIPTPEVWACSRFFLVTEALPDDAVFLVRHLPEPEALVPLTAALHLGGMIHGDLNYRNIYVLPDGRFGLIDLDGACLYRGVPRRKQREREIARVLSSAFLCLKICSPEKMRQKIWDFCSLYEAESHLDCSRDDVFKYVDHYLGHVKGFRKGNER